MCPQLSPDAIPDSAGLLGPSPSGVDVLQPVVDVEQPADTSTLHITQQQWQQQHQQHQEQHQHPYALKLPGQSFQASPEQSNNVQATDSLKGAMGQGARRAGVGDKNSKSAQLLTLTGALSGSRQQGSLELEDTAPQGSVWSLRHDSMTPGIGDSSRWFV